MSMKGMKGTTVEPETQELWEGTDDDAQFFKRFTLYLEKLQIFNPASAKAKEGIASLDSEVRPVKRADREVMAGKYVFRYHLNCLGNQLGDHL